MIARIRSALVLRRFGLAALTGGESASGVPPSADADAWNLFLAVERCAMPLLEALGDDSPDMVRDAAARESAPVLAATAQAAALGAAAQARGLRTVLLKGAAELFEPGPSIALGDLDVLVASDDLEPARALIHGLGYEPAGHGSAFRHDPPFLMPGGIPLELHTSIEKYGAPPEASLFERAEPLEGVPGLHRLSPPDHVRHVLLHATEDHFHRRGRIRDLLLLARVLSRMDGAGRQDMERLADAHAYTEAVSAHLQMAESLSAGREPPDDPFEAEAAALYLTYRWLSRSRPVANLMLPTAAEAPAALLARGPEFRDLWLEIGRFPHGMSSYRGVAGVERAVPVVGRIVRLGGRVLRTVAASVAAILVTPVARRLAGAN